MNISIKKDEDLFTTYAYELLPGVVFCETNPPQCSRVWMRVSNNGCVNLDSGDVIPCDKATWKSKVYVVKAELVVYGIRMNP